MDLTINESGDIDSMGEKPLYEFEESTREFLIEVHFKMHWRAKVIGKSEGAFGDVYRIDKGEGVYPRYLAVKCPKIKRFGSKERALSAIENALHEVEKTYNVFSSPWVNRFFDIKIIHGWPFLLSRWHNGTLADLIGNPLAWSLTDRIASLLQIVRALGKAKASGISAHQDLKPENIFFVDLHRKFPDLAGGHGLHYQVLVGDFGNADLFRDAGKNSGTRPYMAPEQFRSEVLDASDGTAMDVFALGIIAHECLCNGLHPIGEITSDVWPQRAGVSRKWGEAKVWREWAMSEDKDLSGLRRHSPIDLFKPLSDCLAVNPANRPTLEELETYLWQSLILTDPSSAKGIRFQIDCFESNYQAESWPYFDERIDVLRKFYSHRS